MVLSSRSKQRPFSVFNYFLVHGRVPSGHLNMKIKTVLFFSVSYFYFLSLKSLEKKTLRIYFNNFRSQEGHSKCTIDTQLFCITADYLKNKLFVPLTNNLIINNSSI